MVTRLGSRRAAQIVVSVVALAAVAPWAISGARAVTVNEIFGGTTTTSVVPSPEPVNEVAPDTTVVDTTPPTTQAGAESPVVVPVPVVEAPLPEVTVPALPIEVPTALMGTGDGAELGETDSASFPADLQAMTNSVVRTPARNTRTLLDALVPLANYGVSADQAVASGFGRFPVGGLANYSHDWWFPRFGPGWRLHEGTDIFAAFNTPVRAPASGRVHITNGGLGGLAVYVIEPNRTYWYLAHLAGLQAGIADGVEVTAGQVVGFVGDSGNAKGGAPHLHFELHPAGGPAVDPKATLDQFLDEAIAGVPALVEAAAQQAAATATAAQAAEADRQAKELADRLSLEGSTRSALLWASSMNPPGGAVELAQAEALRAAAQIDWQGIRRAELQRQWDQMMASAMVRNFLNPLTPPVLTALLGSN